MQDSFNSTSTMDAKERMQKVAASSSTPLLDFFTGPSFSDESSVASCLASIPSFRSRVAGRLFTLLDGLRNDYLSGARGPAPASPYLNNTRSVYEFVRITLGIRMHGSENYHRFEQGPGVEDVTVGQNVSLIHEVCWSLLFNWKRSLTPLHRLFVMERCNPSLLIFLNRYSELHRFKNFVQV